MGTRLGKHVVVGLSVLASAALALGLTPSATGAATPAQRANAVISRAVVLEVENHNETAVACLPDDESYRLHARLVGPRSEVLGADADRINVLVHDATTGGWFWNLRQ